MKQNAIAYPSQNGWITPRTTDLQLTSDNCRILVNHNIEQVESMIVKGDTISAQLSYSGIPMGRPHLISELSTTQSEQGLLEYLDITKYVVEYSKWMTQNIVQTAEGKFPFLDELYKNNTFYYEKRSNEIILIGENYKGKVDAWGQYVIDLLVNSALNDMLNVAPLYIYYKGTNPHSWVPIQLRPAEQRNDLRNAQFRIYYTPISDKTKLNVYKTNLPQEDFAIPFSQQQQVNSATSLGRNMQGTVNRMGVKTKEVVGVITDPDKIKKLGTTRPNENGGVDVLTAVDLELHQTYIMVKETWSEDYNNISPYVGIDRQFRSWDIPANIVERNLHDEEFLVITKTKQSDDTAHINHEALQELLRGLDTSHNVTQFTECNNLWLMKERTPYFVATGVEDGYIYNGVALTCSAMGFANSLVFAAKTKDNLSAGIQLSVEDKSNQYCRDVYYCKDDGTLDTMWVTIGSAMQSNQPNTENLHPYSSYDSWRNISVTGEYTNAPDKVNGITLFDLVSYDVLKDPAEQLNFTYQLHFATNIKNIIIGTTWASTNPLVRVRDNDVVVKVWALTKKLPNGAQTMTNYWGTPLSGVLYLHVTFDYANLSFTMKKIDNNSACVGMALTDADNNILFAQNENKTNTYYLSTTHSVDNARKMK